MILEYPANLEQTYTTRSRMPKADMIREILTILSFGGEWTAEDLYQATKIKQKGRMTEALIALEQANRILLGRDRNGQSTYIAKEYYDAIYT